MDERSSSPRPKKGIESLLGGIFDEYDQRAAIDAHRSAQETIEKIRACFANTRKIPASLKENHKAVKLARMISDRSDFRLRCNDLWSDSAKIMADFILSLPTETGETAAPGAARERPGSHGTQPAEDPTK